MAKEYNPKEIEEKWQKMWAKKRIFETKETTDKPKFYILDMFPYVSGEGIHVGHPKGYIATDIVSRMKRMQGFNVLHPMGFDAFGLPAENYAIKTKTNPVVAVAENIKRYKKQLEMIGFDYDWSREVNTSDPKFYRWTQWIFLKLLEKGLAYESNEPVNWCPVDKTILANEDVENGKCERCGTLVEKRPIRQWVLKITDYAERLLDDLEELDWPKSIKESQKNWIGRSEGAEIEFEIRSNPSLALPKGEGKENYLILPGWQSGPNDHFYQWLKKELEPRKVQVVKWSGQATEEWVNFVLDNYKIDENTIIVGHSLGVAVGMKIIEKLNHQIIGFVTVAGFIEPKFKDHSRPFVNTFNWKFDFEKIKEKTGFIKILNDLNDYAVPSHQGKILAEKLDGELIQVIAKKPHFTNDDEPLVLDSILARYTHPLASTRREAEFGYYTTDPKTWRALQNRVLEMRQNQTEAEKILWESLRKNLTGFHFRRQHIIGRFVVDFVCLEKSLVVEVDGDIHDYQKNEDLERTSFLKQNGFTVVRFRNKEVLKNIKSVVSQISSALEALPLGEGLGGVSESVKVFTTRPDTIFGATYMVLAPEHPFVTDNLQLITNKEEVLRYIDISKSKNDIERSAEGKEKTGVELKGVKAVNPATKEEIPVWIADYVLPHYGTGAIMAVPADDERDREFAEKYHLPIVENYQKAGFEDFGKKIVKYKLRDWVFSRQRYWGEPIPVLRDGDKVIPLKEKDLPLKLPKVEFYEPTGTAESPLANIPEWINVKVGKKTLKRESNTMPQWAGSSWYYLRFMDPTNDHDLVGKEKEKYWNTVDLYVGGAEHATRHLIYARFWHKFLYDIGVVSTKEPFKRLQHVGLIIAEDGRKMSKRWGNIINPDEIIGNFGADTLRLYEMFMGPFEQATVWNESSLVGPRRFLEKVWKLQEKLDKGLAGEGQTLMHQTIKKVTEDIEAMKFNTAVSTLMILVNDWENRESISKEEYETLLKLLAPFAPHIAEELWHLLGNGVSQSIHQAPWPQYDETKLVSETVTIVVQVNGRVRGQFNALNSVSKTEAISTAEKLPEIKKWIGDKTVEKMIYVPGKLVNIVVS